jgi:hypothetical protein
MWFFQGAMQIKVEKRKEEGKKWFDSKLDWVTMHTPPRKKEDTEKSQIIQHTCYQLCPLLFYLDKDKMPQWLNDNKKTFSNYLQAFEVKVKNFDGKDNWFITLFIVK